MRIDLYAAWSNVRQDTVTGLPDDLPHTEIVRHATTEMDARPGRAHTAAVRTDGGVPLWFVYRDGRVCAAQL